MKLGLTGLKVVIPTPKVRHNSGFRRVNNKIVYGTVIEPEDGIFKVSVEVDKNSTKEEILDFTTESFEVKNRLTVFIKQKDKNGKRTRVIRDEWKAKVHPGSTEHYIPFNKNWIIKGYIVKDGFIRLFDFKELVGIDGYVIKVYEDE